ncbi:MAG: zinc-dependent alcohol dehydrogenase family protein [Lachnospiraceae bacterium]|nr:zinc-dependent alcohol dehydrogenase family protein [Lachnospiraceae bacterium]
MKGTYFLGKKKFNVCDLPIQENGDHDVLIRVAACGICGTDVHIYQGGKGSADIQPPLILGHELAGIVEKVGSAVMNVKPGDHVTVDPNIYCGKCHYCRIGKKQLCENLSAIGVNRNGGFAEYCMAPDTQCYLLNDDIPLKYGAMTEPLACCIHGIDRSGIKQGDTVCIIGGGAIGLMMVQLAKLSGASKVVLSEPVDMRRQIGLKLGADAVIDPAHEEISQKLQEISGAPGADVVIECVGNVNATEQAFKAAKRGTTLVLFSVPKEGSIYELHLEEVYQKELTILGSMVNPDTHERAVKMINSGMIQMESIITHSYPVEQLEEAILMQMKNESIKVIVEP